MADNVFKGSIEIAKTVEFEPILAKAESPSCDFYSHAFSREASDTEVKGQQAHSLLFRFLFAICSFHPTFGNREQPYGPMFVMDGRRGILPEDLTPSDLDVVRVLYDRSTDPALKARLGDVLWVCCKDFKAARISAECYLAAGKRLVALAECWSQAMDQFARAIQLSSNLGRRNEPFTTIVREIEDATLAVPPDEKSFKACQMMDVLLTQEVGDPSRMIGVAAKHADAAREDPRMSRAYWEVEARWLTLAGKKDEAKAASRNAAETLILEAEARVRGPSASLTAGTRFLAMGIEALRQCGDHPQRIEHLRRQLLDWQSKIHGEMKQFEYEMDLTGAVAKAREHVKAENFENAVLRLASGHPLISPSELRDDVLKSAKEHPLTHIFGATYIDGDGRVLDTGIGLLNPNAENYEGEVQSQMVQHATSFIWGLRAAAYIEPARAEIQQAHHPRVSDVIWLIRGHPFVPPGHEDIIGRGLLAGFHGDWIMTALFLVPQIENSVRHVLKLDGVDVSNLMSDLTQPLKVCAQIIGHEKAKQVFGEEMIFELKGLLLDKRGYQLRHQIAHGMADLEDCISPATVNVWWLFLRICVIGAVNARRASTPAKEAPAQDAAPGS